MQRAVVRYAGAAVRTTGVGVPASVFALDPTDASPSDLATDGSIIWVTDDARDEVFVYDASGGSPAGGNSTPRTRTPLG